jgi:microcystin-dependent protein
MKVGSAAGATGAPADNYYAMTDEAHMLYTTGNPTTKMGAAVSNAGGSEQHSNLQPSGVISFCIALQGVYPSRP